MLDSLRMRARRWLAASIANRLAAALFALTLGFLSFAGTVNFIYLFKLAVDAAEADLSANADRLAASLSRELNEIAEHSRIIARNPTVVSSVLDVKDQETYLAPLLKSAQRRDHPPQDVCVTDFKGQSVSCLNGPKTSYSGEAWLEQALHDSTARAVIRRSPEGASLLLVEPVIYEGTGAAEGLVVSEFGMRDLVLRAITNPARFPNLLVADASGDLFTIGSRDTSIHVEPRLELSDAYRALGLRMGAGIDRSAYVARIVELTGTYVAAALLFAFGALLAVRRIVPRLTARLKSLADEADRVAGGGSWTPDAEGDTTDEIGQLTRSFSVMIRRLRQANESLEQQVAERTEALNRQQQLLVSILDTTPGMVFQLRRGPDGRMSMPFASNAMRDLYGLDPETVRNSIGPIVHRVHREDRAQLFASFAAGAEAAVPTQDEYRIVSETGAVRWISSGKSAPSTQPDGSTTWHGFAMDVTARKLTELSLAQSEAYNKALFEASYLPIVVMDPKTSLFVDCNDSAVRIHGLSSREQLVGRSPVDMSAATQYDGTPSAIAAPDFVRTALSNGSHAFEWRHQRPDGEIWDSEVRLMRVFIAGEELLHFALRDITEQKRTEAEIWRRANFDALTGLANRGLLRDRLDRSIAQARRNGRMIGVMYIDLDQFKTINDTLGHIAGDELLTRTARRLEAIVRRQDTAARIGGDEFVLVIQDIQKKDDLRRIAQAVVAGLNDPFPLAAGERRISTSVGIAVFPDDGSSVDRLLELADHALYRAKRLGKNRYFFHTPAP